MSIKIVKIIGKIKMDLKKMKIKKITKPVLYLGLISFFTDFASEMLYPITPLFLTSILGASMAAVGIVEGIAEITAGLLKGYFGNLSDKLGKRSVFVMVGYGLSGIIKPIPGVFVNFYSVLISRVTDRIGKGIRTAPRDALLASYAEGNTGAIFGFHRAMDTFGAVVGPLIALLILYFIPDGYKTIYLISIIPSLFAIYFTTLVKDREIKPKQKNNISIKNFWQNSKREYKTLLFVMILFSLVNSSDVFLILKSKEIAKSDTIAILGYVFYNLVYALFSYPIGVLADKFGKKNIFVTGLFVFAFVYLGFSMISHIAVIWILFLFYGFYAASSEGVIKAWISDLVISEFRGTAIGIITTCMSLATMLGSVLTGILWDFYGAEIPFIITSVVSGAIGLFLLKFK